MFENPLSSLMLMQLLCFSGTLVMFLFVIRSLSSQNALLKETMRQSQMALADLERQMMDMSFTLRRQSEADSMTEPQIDPLAAPEFMAQPSSELLTLLDHAPTAAGSGAFLQNGLSLDTPRTVGKEQSAPGTPLDIRLER